jgi:signal transduction histidine kinase
VLKKYLVGILLLFSFCAIAQQQQIDSLTVLYDNAPENKQHELGMRIANLYANANPNKAIDWALLSINNTHSSLQEAQTKQFLGYLYFRIGNLNKSIEAYRQALQISNDIGNEPFKAQVQSALGGTYFLAGNLSESASNYLQALRFFEAQQDKNSMVSVYIGLANIYNKQNNFAQAIEYNLKAINIYEASSNKFKILIGYDQVGNLYQKQGNYAKANEYLQRALKLYVELNNLAGQSSLLLQIGSNQFAAKQYSKAVDSYNQSIKLSKKLNMLPVQAAACNGLALSYAELKLYDKAIVAGLEAQQIAQKASLKIELEQAYETLSKLYKTTEKHDKATTFENLSKEIKDSLYNDSTLKQLADLQLRFDGEKNKRKIELQTKEQQVLASELLREKQVRNSIVIILLIVLLGLAGLSILYFQNKKIAKNLSIQKIELEATSAAILKQKEELGQLNNVKDRFFSIISHDLRNNLTTMKLYFDLVSNPDYEPSEDMEDMTKQISSSVENTIDLLENLLVWAQAQIKGVDINPQKLTLQHLIKGNIDLLAGNAHTKNIELSSDISADLCAFADEDMINLVIRNLISNAIKFTPKGGSIRITAHNNNNTVQINITDTGVGISKANLEKLFVKNSNPTTLGTANEKGTGLGLLLCKEFIEKNNGSINVSSQPEKGSTFTIILPPSA